METVSSVSAIVSCVTGDNTLNSKDIEMDHAPLIAWNITVTETRLKRTLLFSLVLGLRHEVDGTDTFQL